MRNPLLAFASAQLSPPKGLEIDFSSPRGEPALVPPQSVSWRIFKNPVSLFVGGVAAVILELAEPSVRSGVWDHSSFRTDAVTRLRRTGAAAMITVYGPRSAAERMIAGVVRMHGKVRGETRAGVPYRADDPRLLDWVQATASFGFIEAYHRFARPLSYGDRSQAFGEGADAARLYGALGAPLSLAEWEALLAATEPSLEASPELAEFLAIMRAAPIVPAPARGFQRLLVRAAVDIVPVRVRATLGLATQGLRRHERPFVRALGALADRIALTDAPPAQASVRMGLPADYLYR